MNKPMDRRRLGVAGIALAVIAFLGLNTFGYLDLSRYRLDLTQTGDYSLSPGTERLLGEITEPITLRLYASRALSEANPYLGTYAARVRDLLASYAAAANGQITIDYIDPEPFSPEEDRAVGLGLQAITLDQDTNGYFGIAGCNSTDDTDVLPVLAPDREPFLEYDLTRLIYNLANPTKPVAAVISALPLNGDPQNQYQPWAITEQLKQFFELRQLGGDVARLDADVKLLLLVQPQYLSEKTLYAIDNFTLRGGRVLAFVDPVSEAQAMRQQQQQMGPPATGSDLPQLFERWGLSLLPAKVAGDPMAARQVLYPTSDGRQQVVDYLPWMALDEKNFAAGDIVTNQLGRINLASAGILEPRAGATTSFTPLLSTSPDGMAIDAEKVSTYPDPFALQRDFKPGGKPLVMAARIEGEVETAFPNGRPANDNDGPEPIAKSTGPVKIVVVADTDLLDDRNWLASQGGLGRQETVPVADNASFVANAMDYLAGSDELIGLRQRASTNRPFLQVAEIRRGAEQQYRAKEQELIGKLRDLQTKLASIQPAAAGEGQGGEEAELVSDRQRQEIDGFRTQLVDTRAELREVQLSLRKDIDQLRSWLQFLNIAAVPILIGVVAIALALVQRARYRRRVDAAAS